MRTKEQYAKHLEEIRMWVSEHVSFACDCNAYQESDTGAWTHDENKCAVFMEDHIDIVLREVAELFVPPTTQPHLCVVCGEPIFYNQSTQDYHHAMPKQPYHIAERRPD